MYLAVRLYCFKHKIAITNISVDTTDPNDMAKTNKPSREIAQPTCTSRTFSALTPNSKKCLILESKIRLMLLKLFKTNNAVVSKLLTSQSLSQWRCLI